MLCIHTWQTQAPVNALCIHTWQTQAPVNALCIHTWQIQAPVNALCIHTWQTQAPVNALCIYTWQTQASVNALCIHTWQTQAPVNALCIHTWQTQAPVNTLCIHTWQTQQQRKADLKTCFPFLFFFHISISNLPQSHTVTNIPNTEQEHSDFTQAQAMYNSQQTNFPTENSQKLKHPKTLYTQSCTQVQHVMVYLPNRSSIH